MTNDNNCKNCKYFVKHYMKDKYGRFRLIDGAGHCKHSTIQHNYRKKVTTTGAPCKYFEQAEVNPQENKRTVLDNLQHARLLLYDIVRILKEDKT